MNELMEPPTEEHRLPEMRTDEIRIPSGEPGLVHEAREIELLEQALRRRVEAEAVVRRPSSGENPPLN